jgi:hypothetical protein
LPRPVPKKACGLFTFGPFQETSRRFRPPDFVEAIKAKPSALYVWRYNFLRIPLAIDPIQKFDEPLTIDPKQDFLTLWIILRKFLIAATGTDFDVYPNLAVD